MNPQDFQIAQICLGFALGLFAKWSGKAMFSFYHFIKDL